MDAENHNDASSTTSSTKLKPFGKSNRSRTSVESLSNRSSRRFSVDSTSGAPNSLVEDSPETTKPGARGLSKLLRRRQKKDKWQLGDDASTAISSDNERDLQKSRSEDSQGADSLVSTLTDEDQGTAGETEAANLLTDDEEPEKTPPLTTRPSHTGFYTMSSPLIQGATLDATNTDVAQLRISADETSAPESQSTPELARIATESTATLGLPTDRTSKRRSVSPARRLKEVFAQGSEKNGTGGSDSAELSERSSLKSQKSKSSLSAFGNVSRRNTLSAKRSQTLPENPPPVPTMIRTDITDGKPANAEGVSAPKTPTRSAAPAPVTTVTPPTPTDPMSGFPPLMTSNFSDSPESVKSPNADSGGQVSPSGSALSHRRVRSASAAHRPSRLSNSVVAFPPLEEATTPSAKPPVSAQANSFFSSVFSAAQSAASTLSNSINAQVKNRNLTSVGASDGGGSQSSPAETQNGSQPNNGNDSKTPLAVDTLGSGDLSFSHLDIDAPSGGETMPDGAVNSNSESPAETRRNTVYRRDEEAAKLEDRHAARAVSLAYEKPADLTSSAVAEAAAEPHSNAASGSKSVVGDQISPAGSVVDGDIGELQRSGSVRSRVPPRRHRGSSGATVSTLGATGGNAIAMGAPGANASVQRLTGFAVASKKRNRDFHQLFRSVPEDDYLIEDYSCALQREIILAGRIYISEGHICFSSNILGWVTTLVISFDEIVAIEKENTAMVFPNAIAIQTLHARHTFRSLLSRESTYDLMVNIWKINHPALKSSLNGTRISDGTGDKTEKINDSDAESGESDEDEIYDEDEEGQNADSFYEAGDVSAHSSDTSIPTKGLSHKASGQMAKSNTPTAAAAANAVNGDSKTAVAAVAMAGSSEDFPGPPTHPPTEFNEPNSRYDKVLKDEIIPAPLGKVYSLVFGPASVNFMTKFLVENQKSAELQYEDKKGLSNENKTRQYSYIKPLNGSIGPKQTKCITTETLDFLDLEKAMLVTLGTQTPDVPSGNVFTTKTKYLFTWAPGNQTRFLMTCTIEWTGKSWLKGPIEKGAFEGQTAFSTELIKSVRAAVGSRGRINGVSKAGAKAKHRRRKGDASDQEAAIEAGQAGRAAGRSQVEAWGVLEPLRGPLGPLISLLKPFWTGNVAVAVIGVLLFMVYFRSPAPSSLPSHELGHAGLTHPQRIAAYEEMWRREETDFWHWLEERVGMDGLSYPNVRRKTESQTTRQKKLRFKLPSERDLQARLSEERMSDREMDHAIRTTRERLDVLEEMLNKRKAYGSSPGDGAVSS